MQRIKIEGMRFGRWLVLRYVENRNNHSWYECICDCGTKRLVSGNYMRSGKSLSCDCLRREVISKHWAQVRSQRPHWKALRSIHHGMVTRCKAGHLNQKNYYARGITVCAEWHRFERFYEWALIGFAPGLTIDRIDNDKGYSPSNCRWVTHAENMRNKRCHAWRRKVWPRVKSLKDNGFSKAEIARRLGVSEHKVYGVFKQCER